MASKIQGRKRRKLRIRKKVQGTPERPRLSVFRSSRHIYAQVVDDTTGHTLASASTMTKAYRDAGADAEAGKKGGAKSTAARQVGALVAQACKAQGIERVVFDRNGYLYHGRVKALAEAARKGGLDF